MRLKSIDGALSLHNNGNPDVLNSPKRLNTLQNSNVTTINNYNRSLTKTTTLTTTQNTTTTTTTTNEEERDDNEAYKLSEGILNNININSKEWCATTPENLNNRGSFNINNTLALRTDTETASSVSSPDDSFLEYEVPSSTDISPEEEEERHFDVESDSEDGNLNLGRGIVNPNYPGFQHLAHTLDFAINSDEEESGEPKVSDNNNNNNNNEEDGLQNDLIDSVNRLDSVENIQKVFYDKPVLVIEQANQANQETNQNIVAENIVGDFGEDLEREFGRIKRDHLIERAVQKELEEACEKLAVVDLQPAAAKYNIEPNIEQPFQQAASLIESRQVLNDAVTVANQESGNKMACVANGYARENMKMKLADAFLSNVQQDMLPEKERIAKMEVVDDSNKKQSTEISGADEVEKFCKEDKTKDEKEKDDDSAVPRKKEKMEFLFAKKRRDYSQQVGSLMSVSRREFACRSRDALNRRSLPIGARDKSKKSHEILGGFDVYNIETAMPKIDLDVIESHLRAAREEERRRRTDREEIRRRLAMGHEEDYYNGCDRPGRKPSLQARLQSGMNLQICFMNETVSDTESPSSDSECTLTKPKQTKISKCDEKSNTPAVRPATLSIGKQPQSLPATINETDFFTQQARLQTEARMALAQAKEMARMQMEIERQKQKQSPITEMVRHSMEKVGIPFPEDRRRLSRQILTEMNVAQLQVIVNDLHSQIEKLNEQLVKFLMNRDDLHMEQDSMLVDIEDLTRFLGAKEQMNKDNSFSSISSNNLRSSSPAPSPMAAVNSVKPHFNRIANRVMK